jgi:hypothetical protein
MPGLLKPVATELENYKLDFVVVEEFRLKKWALNGQKILDFPFKGNES